MSDYVDITTQSMAASLPKEGAHARHFQITLFRTVELCCLCNKNGK